MALQAASFFGLGQQLNNFFHPAWIKSIYTLISATFVFILILWTRILGFWVNLKSLSVVHLLWNSSSASWNLQIVSSFKQLGFFPPSEHISRFPGFLHVAAPQALLSFLLSSALSNPHDVHLTLQCPTSGRAVSEVQVSTSQYAGLNSYSLTVHTSTRGLAPALR